MEFMRRLASHEGPEVPALSVDTSVLKDYQSKTRTFDSSQMRSTKWGGSASPPAAPADNQRPASPPQSMPSALSQSLPEEEGERFMRRRRSHSECLFLAKQQGGQNLPGPCQEYISNVKQILAKNQEVEMQLKRRRSMSLRQNAQLFK